MPYAVTHIILTIVLVDLTRDYVLKKKRALSNKFLLLAGLGGILPDIDILFNSHKTLTHTIWFALIFLIGALAFYKIGNTKFYKGSLMLSVGISIHLLLDGFLSGGLHPLLPFSGVLLSLNLADLTGIGQTGLLGLDAIILLVWLWHEEYKHRISGFI